MKRAFLLSYLFQIYGDGSYTRSFMYISDLVEGLIRLMNSNITGPVNLGNPHEFTIRELANIVKDLTSAFCPISINGRHRAPH